MHESPPHAVDNRDLIDLLIAISVVARHLARKLEMKGSEDNCEQHEQPGNDPGRTGRDGPDPDRLRRSHYQSDSFNAALAGRRYARRPQYPGPVRHPRISRPTCSDDRIRRLIEHLKAIKDIEDQSEDGSDRD